jgi:hypothetical protein
MRGQPSPRIARSAAHHTEWWIPADELDALNDNIVGLIEVIRHFGGKSG